MKRRSAGGFTLLEILVVVGIVSVLASVAVPGMIRNANLAKRTEAIEGLATISRMEDAFFQGYGYYTDNLQQLGFMMDAVKGKGLNAWTGRRYTFAVTTFFGGTNYAAVAVGNIDGDEFKDMLYVAR